MESLLSFEIKTSVAEMLSRHEETPGISIGLIFDYDVIGISAGLSRPSTSEVLTTDHYLECASLSKTVASAFTIDYFTRKSISLSTSVNQILEILHSPWRINVVPQSTLQTHSADAVTLFMLMNHSALGMHYVYGIPLSSGLPPVNELLDGTHFYDYKYAPLYLERIPGETFKYSGGGFLVLQHILELFENNPIEDIMRPYLDMVGLKDFTFHQRNKLNIRYAYGHIDLEHEVQPDDGGRLAFPPLAAGGLCTATALSTFLSNLAKGCSGISHDVARTMLSPSSLIDKGSIAFMGAKAGYGVFVATAGPNRIMLHQAANDGFRGVYFLCFEGPDRGNGAVLLTNGDNSSLYLLSEVATFILGDNVLSMKGVDFNRVSSNMFSMENIPQEVIVNLGLKELVFKAFVNDDDDDEAEEETRSPIKVRNNINLSKL
eukprot:gene5252-10507_t